MKAYGLPRDLDVEFPDLADIRYYGLKSSRSRLPGKGGDIKNSFHRSAAKRATRRIWKKRARLAAKRKLQRYRRTK
jgi:hypothetical protein